VPGEDLVIADPPNLGAVARQLLRDPDRLASLSAHALATARQPPISAAAEALIRVADRVARRSQGGATLFPQPSRRGGRATAPDRRPLAVWVPQVGRLPGPGHAGDPALAAVVRELADVRRRKAVPTAVPPARPIRTAVLDVVCTACDGDGPLGVTLASLDAALASTGRPDDVAIHVAGVPGTTGVLPPADLPIASWVLWDEPIGRGAARNDLVGRGSAPWLLVLDAGDELLPGVLELLSAETGLAEPPAAILPLAVLGAEMVVNALPPDPRRLERHAYLGRGYVIRRETLDGVDGFAESPDLAGLEDHVLWNRLAIAQAPVRLVRSFGFRLWPQQAPARLIDLDPGRTAASLRDAIVERPRARSAAR
jgi:hypothetical protein